MKEKTKYPEFTEKGVKYMMCSSHYYMKCNCGGYVAVGEDAVSVKCSTDVLRTTLRMFPNSGLYIIYQKLEPFNFVSDSQ